MAVTGTLPAGVASKGLEPQTRLEQLELLQLTDNPQINDQAVPHLSKLKNLFVLKLGGTGINPAGGRKIADEIERLGFDDLGL